MNRPTEYREHSLCDQCAPLILHEGKLRVEQPEWNQRIDARLGPVSKFEERKSCPLCRLVASAFRAHYDLFNNSYVRDFFNYDEMYLRWGKRGFSIYSLDRFAAIRYIVDDIVPQTDKNCSKVSQGRLINASQIDVSHLS